MIEITLTITVDIFSGRENPSVELGKEEAKEVLEHLKPSRKLTKDETRQPTSTLGYRGLIFEQTDMLSKELPKAFRLVNGNLFGRDLAHRATDENFEDFFCGTKGPIRKFKEEKGFPELVRGEMMRYLRLTSTYIYRPFPWPINGTCVCAPLYEPNWWNDGGQKQFNNNCYNYATNYRTDTFAQPGRAAGAMYTALTCSSVKPAAVADCLIDRPGANNECPDEGHLVALVVWPNVDFHWYRKGRNGLWTHKPGGTQVTNLDNSAHTIADPRTANRGPYTIFCTFMVVMHGHIKIK